VNHAPVATAQSVTTNEDTAKPIALAATDADGDALAYVIVSPPLHGTLSGIAPNVSYTPAADYNGADSFTFKVNDGTVDSAAATVSIAIAAVNDAPSFIAGPNQIASADAPTQITVANWATAISAGPLDEAGQLLNFIVTTNNPAFFAEQPFVSATGTLTYLVATGVTGTASVSVQLHDSGGTANGGVDTSAAQTFTITIAGKPSLSIANSSVLEGDGGCSAMTPMAFTVTMSVPSAQSVSASYTTMDGTASGDLSCGTRSKGYIKAQGTITFAPGETSKTITVMVVGDTSKELNQTLTVRLSSAVNATITRSDAIGTIVDDDQ
jgi:hypothetical protein